MSSSPQEIGSNESRKTPFVLKNMEAHLVGALMKNGDGAGWGVLMLLLQVASVVFDCVTPLTQPAKLLCPWDSLGKNTGVGCHFLLQVCGQNDSNGQ